MEGKLEKSDVLEEGKHSGVITDVKLINTRKGSEEFTYLDIFIQPEGMKFSKKVGVPYSYKENSRMMKLISKFGNFKIGDTINPVEILMEKEVTFLVKEDGEYTKIDWETVKPAEAKASASKLPYGSMTINGVRF